MSAQTTVGVAASSSLQDVNTIVAQQEAFHGPLTAMGNDGAQSLLTFDNTPAKPATNAVVAPQNAGSPVIPPGAALVCAGTIFIAGQLTLCAATRA